MNAPLSNKFFLDPGYVCLPSEPMRLASVVASGVAITIFDRQLHRGGMSVYTHPVRIKNQSTAVFAAPAIASLVRMFKDIGARTHNLEAHLCGGAVNKGSLYYIPGHSEENVRIARELLNKFGIEITGNDTGGNRARKVVFHSGTGEIVIAKVGNVRRTDWYPPYDPKERKKREQSR